jgi:TatD DNase family protein
MAPADDDRRTLFFDSHAHLSDSAFEGDRDQVIQRARESGAQGIVCIGSILDAGDLSEQISNSSSGFINWTTGVHPHEASSFDASRDIELIRAAVARGAAAIGECGLDYHYDNSPREVQRTVFEAQIGLAAETGKPLVVHTRDADDDTRAMIEAAGPKVKGVLHCYTGSAQLAEVALALGWYVSFSGIVTFKAWKNDDLIRIVPGDRILAESDSPYLAPVPDRGKRNEPAWVQSTVTHLALVRSEPIIEFGRSTIRNARHFFGIQG